MITAPCREHVACAYSHRKAERGSTASFEGNAQRWDVSASPWPPPLVVESIMETPSPLLTALPARYYTDPAIFGAELERLYFGRWISAGRTERVRNPGDYFLCELAGESV